MLEGKRTAAEWIRRIEAMNRRRVFGRIRVKQYGYLVGLAAVVQPAT